jgi:hypothetical protein
MTRLIDELKEPFPDDWTPKPGEKVIVPSVSFGKRRAYSATVEIVLNDIVRVRVPYFAWGRQQFLLKQIRPMQKADRD